MGGVAEHNQERRRVMEAGGFHLVDAEAEVRRWSGVSERLQGGESLDSIVASLIADGNHPIDAIKALKYGAGIPIGEGKEIVDRNLSPDARMANERLRDDAEAALLASDDEH